MKDGIAIIGEENFIYGFRGLGIDVFAVENPQAAQQVLEELVENQYPIIYITETYAQEFMELIEQLNKVSSSSIVIIPGAGIDKNLGEQRLKDIIRKAIGTEMLDTDKE